MQKQDKNIYKEIILQAILEKKGENITILDFEGIENAPAELFILCDANSNTQLRAIASSVEEFVLQHLDDKAWHVEGLVEQEWILMDYINIVVHVFIKSKRYYYNLEELWGDTKITHIEEHSALANQ